MTPTDCTPGNQRGTSVSWTFALVPLLVMGLSLAPLACMPSSADSNQPDEAQATSETNAEPAEKTTVDRPAYDDERTVEQRLNDASLAAQIKQALVRQKELRVFDFEPEVAGQTVTLRGDVNTKAQWEQAELVAERTARGRTVINEVTIEGRPASEVKEAAEGTAHREATTAVYHTVRRGESLWQIARQYSASVQRLRGLNSLSSDDLRVGQRIRVR